MKQFLELFNPYPGNQFLLLTSHSDEITPVLAQMLENVNGTLSLHCFPGKHDDVKLDNIKRSDIVDFKSLPRALPRSNDMVILQDVYAQHELKERIIKQMYATLANTGDIIIMQKRGTMDFEKMLEMLEAFEFRAGNAIDCHPDYDLVMGKKMHMWGNGL
ncbi:MAG: hypothetical protein U9P71_08480 [Campylobacterota bacterium]|nr:hypothetical protein [Campylobacterota bacterium]